VRIEVPADWMIVETESFSSKAYGYRFYPNKVKGEGFFMACLRKRSGHSGVAFIQDKLEHAGSADRKILSEWVKDPDEFVFILKNDSYLAVPMNLLSDFNFINKNLSLRKSGTRIGNLIRNKLNPDHELAMSMIQHKDIPSVSLNYHEAICFLRKETMELKTGLQGWILIKYNNIPLGFMKCMPNRANNYYPSDWRIRTESPFK
jgi:NOL1/NOP2/fmu family ribosome biogenesis protein